MARAEIDTLAVVRKAAARHAGDTDSPAGLEPLGLLFASLLATTRGMAALEIGVRAGGTSGVMCELARQLAPPGFVVLSVDPWGHAPYMEAGRDVSPLLDYGDAHYARARAVLAPYANSLLFRLDADTFLDALLPRLRWWHAHRCHPSSDRFLSLVYLDGRHDDDSVLGEVRRVLPHVCEGGTIVIDDVDKCPRAVEILTRSTEFEVRALPHARLGLVVSGQ